MRTFKEGRVKANGLEFYFIEQGEKDGPLALCFHGFPDTCRTYRLLLPALAEAGFRAVAPSLRGYWPTQIPEDGIYQTAALALDAIGLIKALGYDHAVMVGHDWGADAVLGASQLAPDKVTKLVAMAEYYGKDATEFAARDPAERKRSYYMDHFQHDWAPLKFQRNDFEYLKRLRREWSPDWKLSNDELEYILKTFKRAGVTQAALTYDRAASGLDPRFRDPKLERYQHLMDTTPVNVDGLILYGEKDGCHGKEVIEAMPQWLTPDCGRIMINGAGHFLHLEKPELVNKLIVDFLAGD